MKRIVVADDNETNRRLLSAIFEAEGFDVVVTGDGEAAVAEVEARPPAAVLIDLRMPGIGGMEALSRIKKLAPDMPVVILTSHGDVPAAVEATKRGAYDFLIRPIHHVQLVITVRHAIEQRVLEMEVKGLRRRFAIGAARARLASGSAMQAVVDQIEQVAPTDLTVLVHGETGTGKELVARAIHQASARRDKPFVAIDCGAIPENLVESELFGYERGAFSGADRRKDGHFVLASGGTLFFDEVGNLPLAAQATILRAIQERQVHPLGAPRAYDVDVRFIAATNELLEASVATGRLREDLYYRLAEFVIAIPPLRERRDDIVSLAATFQEEASAEFHRQVSSIDGEAIALLGDHPWPGNVRELRNVVRRAVLQARGAVRGAGDVRPLLAGRAATERGAPTSTRTLKAVAEAAAADAERSAIEEALRTTHGNKTAAARLLEVDFKTLHVKMKRLGIEPGD
ncbi:MAG: sigma-54 dependent transcriptional regulator [Proteobacteria bacterium]|nr:sigma-54 dependent transcriptional regulator [Pseudomonadota bacterium]